MANIGSLPYSWIDCNLVASSGSPSTIHCQNNLLVDYFARYLVQRAMSVFDFTLPDAVDERYFKYVLFCNGFIILTYDERFGALAHYGSLVDRDMYYRPKKAIITLIDSDPQLSNTLERVLIDPDESKIDAVLMTLQENYNSILDLVYFHAERLALLFEAFDVNVINSKLAYVFGTDKKSLAETFKKIYDDIQAGNPAVVTDKALFDDEGHPLWTAFFNNLRQNYIGSDIMIDIKKVLNDFDTSIGIPNANTEKRERITTDEVNSNNVEALTLVELWLKNMNNIFKRAAEILPDWSGCSVSLRVPGLDDLMNGGENNGAVKDNTDRDV